MKIRDNRAVPSMVMVEGEIVDIYRWAGGVTITLDTGYSIVLESGEIAKLLEERKD